jgi:hypothetical protein
VSYLTRRIRHARRGRNRGAACSENPCGNRCGKSNIRRSFERLICVFGNQWYSEHFRQRRPRSELGTALGHAMDMRQAGDLPGRTTAHDRSRAALATANERYDLAGRPARLGLQKAHGTARRFGRTGRPRSILGRSRNPRRYWILDGLDGLDGLFPSFPRIISSATSSGGRRTRRRASHTVSDRSTSHMMPRHPIASNCTPPPRSHFTSTVDRNRCYALNA